MQVGLHIRNVFLIHPPPGLCILNTCDTKVVPSFLQVWHRILIFPALFKTEKSKKKDFNFQIKSGPKALLFIVAASTRRRSLTSP
jgi:hypothetical protein